MNYKEEKMFSKDTKFFGDKESFIENVKKLSGNNNINTLEEAFQFMYNNREDKSKELNWVDTSIAMEQLKLEEVKIEGL